ncbi:CDP-alcohol phosphatidyltransferase family protein [Wenxinia marina]|uniref:Phosphatidylglycerophosphate synthase n=1 Tax=Wenxinia marina DSM 24838 TaxID=1123501 RepID=A0A0D0Q8J9_9RHOB|nr:CDP-alcohol phosphatidyltransferase family protein [Wenxinia marina]KIQ67453.1 Phosphatidylglycerophosphate synthase [Wenxinia marina DSM 24838]GGL69410.1 phosphatidylglycerophosphate synthase [Wenxinia marina]
MLDAYARRLIDPPLNRLGARLAARGIAPDHVTLVGLAFGLLAAVLIAVGWTLAALIPIAGSRLCDGLDGAVARASRRTDYGGYLDIATDFLFYGVVPLAFVLNDPAGNGASGAFLLASFYFNGATFLGYAILAEKRRMETDAQGVKSLYFSNGLLEGTETILLFVLVCLLPSTFPTLAWIFGALCFLSGALRLWGARLVFRERV